MLGLGQSRRDDDDAKEENNDDPKQESKDDDPKQESKDDAKQESKATAIDLHLYTHARALCRYFEDFAHAIPAFGPRHHFGVQSVGCRPQTAAESDRL